MNQNSRQIYQLYSWCVKTLTAVGITNPALETKILLAYVLDKSQEDLFLLLHQNIYLTPQLVRKFITVVTQRRSLTPVAYITNHKEFYSLPFYVDHTVLIPRPDTETLIECAIEYLNHYRTHTHSALSDSMQNLIRICDLCTGSGCILLSILYHTQNINILGTGIDISDDAILVAQRNEKLIFTQQHHSKINWIVSDMFCALERCEYLQEDHRFDLIVSNPPYISITQKNLITRETLLYEPEIALFAGNDGYEFYYRIAQQSPKFLKPEGVLMLEVGFNQAYTVILIFINNGFYLVEQKQDLAGIIRVLCFAIKRN